MTELHPYEPFIDENTRALIIGTTPPMRFTQGLQKETDDVDFYYGSRDNYFWDLLGDVFDLKLPRIYSNEAIDERKSLMKKHLIGLVDIIQEFERIEGSASDDNLNVLKYSNLIGILEQNEKISKVFFTGGKTESLVSKYLGENKVYNTVVSKDSPKEKVFQINSRDIISLTLYSPSPRAIAVKGYNTVLKQYKNHLYDF